MAPRAPSANAIRRRKVPSLTEHEDLQFSWKEVARHNTVEDAWIISDGLVYDITGFIDKHPGGKEMLALAAGRDCTHLIESYHPFSEKPYEILKKYQIGQVVDSEFPTYKPDSGFYKEVRKRVGKYFETTGKDPKAALPGTLRMIPVFCTAAICFCIMHNALLSRDIEFNLVTRSIAAIIFGICQVLPLLHVMHDASHTAIGHSESIWKFWGRLALDWYAGASMLSWHHQHVVGHHIYTNVFHADPDVPDNGDVRRVTWHQKWDWLYKFQWIYLPIVYGLLGVKVRVDDIVYVWWQRLNGPIRVNYYDSPWIRVVATKGFWATWRIFFPLYMMGNTWSDFFIVFALAELSSGYWLAWNFQVSHISIGADFPDEEDCKIKDEWAVSQVLTGVDYAHGNTITTFLCGALNYQITHHLLPSISQYHYPAIAPIIKDVCREYNLPYRHEPSFVAAFRAHILHLYELGQRAIPASLN